MALKFLTSAAAVLFFFGSMDANAAPVALFTSETINGNPHSGTIKATTLDLLETQGSVASAAEFNGVPARAAVLTAGTIGTLVDNTGVFKGGSGEYIEYNLNTTVNTAGYDITSLKTIASWTDARAGQAWTVQFRLVGGGFSNFYTLGGQAANNKVSQVVLADDGTGSPVLASGVNGIRFNFADAGTTWSGYREIDVIGTPSGGGGTPTIAGSNIVDDLGGAAVTQGALVTYTLTFSKDMDESSFSAAYFYNAGTALISIGAITEISPGVFTIKVTPTSAGTLALAIAANATLMDTAGNSLDASAAIADDTTLDALPFRLAIGLNPSGIGLAWDSRPGKLYNLRSSADLTGNPLSWTLAEGAIVATPPTNQWTGALAGDRKFFVVEEYATPNPEPLSLSSPFQNNMILQRDKPLRISGRVEPSTSVSVNLGGTVGATTSGQDGRWSAVLPAVPAGGPHNLVVSAGAESITLTNVLIGDVWVAFGQSNMVRTLSGIDGGTTYSNAITQNRLPIRCLKVDQQAATTPQERATMTWLDTNPGGWNAVGTVFAYELHQATGVPVAIIWLAWGSTYIEGWMPAEMASDFPHFAKRMETYYASEEATVEGMLDGSITYSDVYIRTRPSIVYNGMIHPILNQTISGFLWYQGEANAENAKDAVQYGFTLPGFVREYRNRFGQGDLPFFAVQLPSYGSGVWPWFRESQTRVAEAGNAFPCVTIDTGSGDLHPSDKASIGIRLARLARKYAYGENIEAHGPLYSSISISGNEVKVNFTHASGLTTTDNLMPSAFQVAGADQIWKPATSASISGSEVRVSSSSVPAPVAVRYAWIPLAAVNLVNGDGLPAAPFRSDSWPVPGLGAQPPQGVADVYQTSVDQPLAVPANGVLANDMDLNRDPLTASLVTDVAHGVLSLLSDGSLTYTPFTGFSGVDSFVYKSFDGSLQSVNTTVEISVSSP